MRRKTAYCTLRLLLRAVRTVVIRSYGEHSHELAISKSRGPACLSDAQRINRINSRWRAYADDFFPLQTIVPVHLRPGQLANLV